METSESESQKQDDKAEYEKLRLTAPFILGADECGYGSWAGPLVTCAVAVPKDWRPPAGLNDSKKLRPEKREYLFEMLRSKVAYAVEMAHSDEIDRDGVISALHRCFRTCIEKVLEVKPGALVVLDGEVKLPGIKHLHFPKADGIVPAVMAASVIGKVLHDRYMWTLAEKYPGYGFSRHQGYGTPEHKAAIAKLGMTPIHRRSYVPVPKEERYQEGEGIALDSGEDPIESL